MSEQFENNEKLETVTPETENVKESAVNADTAPEATAVSKNPKKKFGFLIPIIIVAAVIHLSVIIICSLAIFNVFLKPDHDEQNLFSEKLLCVRDGDKWGYVNKKGKYVIKAKYDKAYNFSENGLALVGQYGEDGELYYGYINKKGKTVIDTKYLSATPFYDCGLARVGYEDGNFGVIDDKGNLVVNCKYKIIEIYDSVIVATFSDGNSYLFNKKGKCLSGKYDHVFWKNDASIGVVYDGDKVGIINDKGKEILKPTDDFDDIGCFNKYGFGCYEKNGHFGIVNKRGIKITDAIYDEWLFFTEYGLSPFEKDGQWGIINSIGMVVLKPGDYKYIYSIDEMNYDPLYAISSQGFIAKSSDGKTSFFFDKNGKKMFSMDADKGLSLADFCFSDNGLLPVRNEDRYYGFINRNGKVVIDCDYYDANSFSSCGLARVIDEMGGEISFINEKGRIIGNSYGYATDYFDDGYAVAVELDGSEIIYKIINEKGKIVCELDCDDILLPTNKEVQSEGITYIINSKDFDKKEFLLNYMTENNIEVDFFFKDVTDFVEYVFKHMDDEEIDKLIIDFIS